MDPTKSYLLHSGRYSDDEDGAGPMDSQITVQHDPYRRGRSQRSTLQSSAEPFFTPTHSVVGNPDDISQYFEDSAPPDEPTSPARPNVAPPAPPGPSQAQRHQGYSVYAMDLDDDEAELLQQYGSGSTVRPRTASKKYAGASSPVDDLTRSLNQVQSSITSVFEINLRTNMRAFYEYYRQKGFTCVMTNALLELFSTVFLIFVFLFVFGCIDYAAMERHFSQPDCPDGTTNLGSLFAEDCFQNLPISWARLGHVSGFIYLCLLFFAAYAAWRFARFVFNYRIWRHIQSVYNGKLRISDADLESVTWDEVLVKFIHCVRNGELGSEFPRDLDQADVHGIICQKDNFFVGLYLQDWFKPTITIFGVLYLFGTLHWSLEQCLESAVFDEHGFVTDQVKDQLQRKAVEGRLKRSFLIYGIANLILAPFVVLFQLSHVLFSNTDAWNRSPAAIISRQWTEYAKWHLREYNELPHVFTERLRKLYVPTSEYLSLRRAEFSHVVARFFIFVGGGVFLLILVFSFVFDGNFLLSEFWFGRSIAWWFAVIGVLLVICRSLVPAESVAYLPEEKMALLRKDCSAFYVFEEKAAKGETFAKVAELFNLKLIVIAEELLSIMLTPYLLIFRFPAQAASIVNFYANGTVFHPVVGDIYSCADYRDTKREDVPNAFLQEGVMGAFGRIEPNAHKTAHSLVNFTAQVPSWVVPQQLRSSIAIISSLPASPSASVVKEDVPDGRRRSTDR